MGDWDWDGISIVSGEWWLVLIAIGILLVGFAAGMTYGGRHKAIGE